ncbi:MAG: serine/tyrosine/threonine adenylyltransferase [Acidimicrobiaceae bacterium]|nr:serine/tyrosine/threonine adenylyltransferase [Acidimicrobiaceae bacterium]
MSIATAELFRFDNSFARELPELYVEWQPATVPAPRLLALNHGLAAELGLDPEALPSPAGVAVLAGNITPPGATPIAMAYAGHQFGSYSPRLGDGRALLLGEVVDTHRRRRDVHLKGSGRTPFARGGDGKAAVGPMLRELLIGEAMHSLGIPTTRALAVVATGEHINREGMLPGAVLTRVASSHIRVGTFEYAARLSDRDLIRRLADHAIARHYPAVAEHEQPYMAFYEGVVEAQAALVARWMLVGFIHGVMNTDNTTISGETIDYGPCAFIDAYDPATVFSSIDQGGRYAYGNQPSIVQWNLARLAETMLPMLDGDIDAAVAAVTDVLTSFPQRFGAYWRAGMAAKLGLIDVADGDQQLFDDLLHLVHALGVDYTSLFRALASVVGGVSAPLHSLVSDPAVFQPWINRWQARLATEGRLPQVVAAGMNDTNPVYIPRNHLVEEALDAATAGDLTTFERLLTMVTNPFEPRLGGERYAEPAPESFGRYYQTFCGT